MSGPAEIAVERDGGIVWVRLNRPDVLNALTVENREHLAQLFREHAEDSATRVLVLTGEGRGFCTGADMRSSRGTTGAPPEALEVARGMREGAYNLINALRDCPKPIIAAVNGVAAGVGVQMALACDLIVAADTARFVQVFARRGLVPDGGAAYVLPRLIGLARAKELLFLGDDIHAADALAMGLINRVVPADQLGAEVTALAGRLAAGPTQAIGLTKALIHRSLSVDFATSLELEAFYQGANSRTHDAREGLMSFVERRPPLFNGS